MPMPRPPTTPAAFAEEGGMELLLWRHAEAEEGYPDLDRKLTARGERQAAQMAAWINAHAPKNLTILASPAVRCQQTAQALGLSFETDKRLGTDGGAADLLAAVGWKAGKGARSVLVVGHQPTLGETAALLLAGEEQDWAIKKGAVWWISGGGRRQRTMLRAAISPDIVP